MAISTSPPKRSGPSTGAATAARTAPTSQEATTALSGMANIPSLRQLPFFAGVPEELLLPLASRCRWQTFARGEVVVDSGDASSEVFFVAEGAVRVVVRTALGYEAILNDLGAGSFFGELAAIDGVARSANVTALQRTRLCAVPGPAFMEVVLASAAAGQRLMRMLAGRLRAKDERLLEFMALPVRQRLMAELLRLSRDRGGEHALSPPPPQHVLAARIGTRRETVSREMSEMVRAHLISVGRRAIVLHRPEALQAEIELRLRKSFDDPLVEAQRRRSRDLVDGELEIIAPAGSGDATARTLLDDLVKREAEAFSAAAGRAAALASAAVEAAKASNDRIEANNARLQAALAAFENCG